jgi:hypothetical protein
MWKLLLFFSQILASMDPLWKSICILVIYGTTPADFWAGAWGLTHLSSFSTFLDTHLRSKMLSHFMGEFHAKQHLNGVKYVVSSPTCTMV